MSGDVALSEPSRRVAGPAAERKAVEKALRLLPATMTYPIMIDPESVPNSTAVRQLDAFTVRETDGPIESASVVYFAGMRSNFRDPS